MNHKTCYPHSFPFPRFHVLTATLMFVQKPIVDRLGEAYDSPTKVTGPSFPSHNKIYSLCHLTCKNWLKLNFSLDWTGITTMLGNRGAWRWWWSPQRCCSWTLWELGITSLWKSFIKVRLWIDCFAQHQRFILRYHSLLIFLCLPFADKAVWVCGNQLLGLILQNPENHHNQGYYVSLWLPLQSLPHITVNWCPGPVYPWQRLV